MFTIQNDVLRATIQPKGAELVSLYHKKHRLEYMWNGDPKWWGKHSPVLFPIVGTLKSNSYFFNNKTYQLWRHGFARDAMFEVEPGDETHIGFLLTSNAETLNLFPFSFAFTISYVLDENNLSVTYEITNTGTDKMYFSVGGHPAFAVPLVEGTAYNDYYLEFDKEENAGRWLISPEGLIETKSAPLLENSNTLRLTKELFYNDALVLKQMKSTSVALLTDKSGHGLKFSFSGFPYLGIWAARDADFVCIEPWCGIADSVESNQQLPQKEGINALDPGEVFERTWKLILF